MDPDSRRCPPPGGRRRQRPSGPFASSVLEGEVGVERVRRQTRVDRKRKLLLDQLGLPVDLRQRHRLEDRTQALERVQVVDERERRRDRQEDQPAVVDRVCVDPGRSDLVGTEREQPGTEDLWQRHERRAVRPPRIRLATPKHDHADVDQEVGGDPAENAREDQLEELRALGRAEGVHQDRDGGQHDDADPGRPRPGQQPAERGRKLPCQGHAVQDPGHTGDDSVQRADGGGDNDEPHEPLAGLAEDRDAHGDRQCRREG